LSPTIPDLRHCSAQGASPQEALAEVLETTRGYTRRTAEDRSRALDLITTDE
jgi:predicted RNase H-like HicB family nuclease